ncbi:MAG: putative sporulation protein YtxC [Clostridia bacterium]|nr:putative sporulation protein YtxC [Clostridia bacterium]
MQHSLSVTGHLNEENIPVIQGIQVLPRDEGITFVAASAEDMQQLKRSLALSLTGTIIDEYENKYLSEIVNAEHGYLNPMERQKILRDAVGTVEKTAPGKRAHYIETRLYEFLAASDVLSIDGFVRFRLKEYRNMLRQIVDKVAGNYITEKEYEEFIALLQYFVSMQPGLVEVLHVIMDKDTCIFLDENEVPIQDACMEDIFFAEAQGTLTKDDVLLSVLITMAPERIVLHHATGNMRHEILETVMQVFCGRVRICENCQICKKDK